MALTLLLVKLKHLVLFFVGIFRRALCCFRRRRRPSFDAEPLTHVGVISDQPQEDWGWEERSHLEEPRTVQEHIELYRKRKAEGPLVDLPLEERMDFFEDMTPRITRQTKVFVDEGGQGDGGASNRLNLIETVPIEGAELREWEENDAGWEGQTLEWDVQEALREKKRKDRERRLWEQQQKRQEKSGRSLGAKVST